MSQYRILFYFPFNKTLTGGPRTLLTLVALLDREKFYPVVVTQRQSALVEELKKRNIEVVVLPLPDILDVQDGKALQYSIFKKISSFFSLLQYNRSLIRFIKENDIKLVWARHIKGVLFVGFASLLTRTVLIWDIGLGDKFKGFVKLLHFMGLNMVDLVITQGKSQHVEMFGRLLPRLYKKKLHHVLPGIEQDKMKVILQLAKIKREDRLFKIISVCSVSPRKNQGMLVEAVRSLAPEFPQIHVEFIGPVIDEAYFQNLQKKIATYNLTDHISFLGWRNDIPELMLNADVLVMCSHNEGIPRVVHEAMHTGLPVVATSVGGIPDAIVDGETGFLVAVNDIEAMAQKLRSLILHPEITRKMGENSKLFARKNFTYQAYYQKYDAILSKLITQH